MAFYLDENITATNPNVKTIGKNIDFSGGGIQDSCNGLERQQSIDPGDLTHGPSGVGMGCGSFTHDGCSGLFLQHLKDPGLVVQSRDVGIHVRLFGYWVQHAIDPGYLIHA